MFTKHGRDCKQNKQTRQQTIILIGSSVAVYIDLLLAAGTDFEQELPELLDDVSCDKQVPKSLHVYEIIIKLRYTE